MEAGWHYYFETGPYLMSLAGIVGALYCKLLRTEVRWNVWVMALVFFFYFGGFGLVSVLAVKSRGGVVIGLTLAYILVGAVILAGMIPNVASALGAERFKRQFDFYEWYWLIIAGVGVLFETIHRVGWA